MKNIFVTLTLRANLFFIVIGFISATLIQYESLISATSRAIFLNRIHVVCNIKDESKGFDPIIPSEVDGVYEEYWKVIWDGHTLENRKLRRECVLSMFAQSKSYPVKTDIGFQDVSPYPVIAGVLIGSLIVSLALLIIKIFLIKASQISTGLFRLSLAGVPVICITWFVSIHSFRKFTLGLLESITQTAITLIAISLLYVLVRWIYKGFTNSQKP
jgi:hypothetical protein